MEHPRFDDGSDAPVAGTGWWAPPARPTRPSQRGAAPCWTAIPAVLDCRSHRPPTAPGATAARHHLLTAREDDEAGGSGDEADHVEARLERAHAREFVEGSTARESGQRDERGLVDRDDEARARGGQCDVEESELRGCCQGEAARAANPDRMEHHAPGSAPTGRVPRVRPA